MPRKTSVAAAVLAFATAGTALFGGAALADVSNTGGPGGNGGNANNNCLQVPIQVPILNILGSSPTNSATCSATANGGNGGGGAQY